MDNQEPIPPPTNPPTNRPTLGMHLVYKVRHQMGVQQHKDQRWGPVESSVHYQRRVIQTNGHVLRTYQLTGYIPNHDEYNLPRSHSQREHDCLYGQYGNSHCVMTHRIRKRPYNPTSKHSKPGTPKAKQPQPIPQPRQMQLRTPLYQLPRSPSS